MPDEADSPTQPTAIANAVSLKLLDFWPSDPELWFAQAEALFATQNITHEKTKFGHVVRVLPAQCASEVRDIILRPPEARYTALKTELQNCVCPSKRQRLQHLLHVEDLGDRKPSQLLWYMLRGGTVADAGEDEIFRELFLQKLPLTVRTALAVHKGASLSELADMADNMAEVQGRFDSIHVDIVGPLPLSKGYTYLFTCIDRYTRWPEAIPMADATAESCVSALLTGWISRFGVPTTITSDQGQQFESDLWHSLMNLLGATHLCITAYHPQANGLVERFHRHLKTGLKARLAGSNWVDDLPVVLLGICATLKEDLSCTSAELVYGTTLRLPGDFFTAPTIEDPSSFVSRLRSSMQHLQFVPTRWHGRRDVYLPHDLHTATHMYVRRDSHKPPLTRLMMVPSGFSAVLTSTLP